MIALEWRGEYISQMRMLFGGGKRCSRAEHCLEQYITQGGIIDTQFPLVYQDREQQRQVKETGRQLKRLWQLGRLT